MTGFVFPAGGHLRFAESGDVDALVQLVESTYRGDSSRKGWTTEADFLDGQRTDAQEIRELLANEKSRVIVHVEDGELLGCCNVENEAEGVAYFGMFSVRSDLQGKGVGRTILEVAERFAKEAWAANVMRMTVIDIREELIAFYERRGYHRTGKHKPFPYGNPRFGLPKRGDLRFEILEKSL